MGIWWDGHIGEMAFFSQNDIKSAQEKEEEAAAVASSRAVALHNKLATKSCLEIRSAAWRRRGTS